MKPTPSQVERTAKAFIVHCKCGHEWTLFHMPIPIDNIPKKPLCPKCGSKNIYCGKARNGMKPPKVK